MFLILLPVDQTRGRGTMKTVNMLHYRFVKNKFGFMSQAPCCKDGAKCVCVKSKPADALAAIAEAKLCQRRKRSHQRLFSIHTTAADEICED